MSFCNQCGKELREGAVFCDACGKQTTPAPESQPAVPYPMPTKEDLRKEEQEYLDLTHNLLRWEKKAWVICGIVYLALAGLFTLLYLGLAGMFLVLSLVGIQNIVLAITYFFLATLYAVLISPLGIIALCAAKKIPQYTDTLYTDLRPTIARCGSVGMLVFHAFFGSVAFVFFLINFIRSKTNRAVIERIVAQQQAAQ